MARRLTLMHQRRQHELADPDSKLSAMRDPDRDPYAKVNAQHDARGPGEKTVGLIPAKRRATVKKKKSKKIKAAKKVKEAAAPASSVATDSAVDAG